MTVKISQMVQASTPLLGDEEIELSIPQGTDPALTRRTPALQVARLAIPPVVSVSGTSRNLSAADANTYMRFTNASAKTLTVQDDATEPLDDNSEYHGRNVGAADLTIVAGNTDVVINEPFEGTLVIPQGGTFTLKRVAADEFDLFGVTVPA